MPFAKLTLDVRFQNAAGRADGRNSILLEELRYTTEAGEVITAPIGTTTDGASTPSVIWPIIPPFGPYYLAVVLHDFLYRVTQRDRSECDSICLEAMKSLGISLLLREAIYEGIRIGGDAAFDMNRRPALRAYARSKEFTGNRDGAAGLE